MEKNLYKILEVNENSTDEEIRNSYKKLAKKYHPDLNKDKNAEEKFKEINYAYEILSDKSKRKEYDLKINSYYNFSKKDRNNFDFDINDFFKNRFGEGFKKSYEEDLNVYAELEINQELANKGGKQSIVINNEYLTITIPQGITDGKILRVIGKGKIRNYNIGDLLITIKIKKLKTETRNHNYNNDYNNNDLIIDFDLPLKIAMFGGKIAISVNGIEINLTIPKNTKTNQKFRVKGMGKTNNINGQRGDLYLISNIIIPKIEELDKTLIKNLKTRLPE